MPSDFHSNINGVADAYFEFWNWAGFWDGFIGCWVSFGLVLIGHCASFVKQNS